MAINAGPKIVEDGLILCLDAANKKSYPRTGTVWTDLTANKKTGTLTNMANNFSTDGAGSLIFDGTDEYVVAAYTQAARIGTGNHTISAWVKNLDDNIEDFVGTGTSQGDILLMIYFVAGGGSGGFRGHAWSSTGASNTIDSPNAIGTGSWNYLTQRVSWGGNIDLFENGVLVKTQALIGSAPSSSRTNLYIGARNTSYAGKFNGNIAATHFYNRALSSSEVLQNYNATKWRFQ